MESFLVRKMISKIYFMFLFLQLFEISFGQSISGNIEGKVVDSTGTSLSGVNISLESESLQGLRGTSTDRNGFFRILSLPIGIYQLKVSLIGYRNVIIENIHINLGRTAYLGQIKLEHEAIDLPEIIISADNKIIDPTLTSYGGNLNTKDFESLPIERNYQDMISLLPQANFSYFGDGANIAGSTGFENKYFVDGVEVNDPGFGVSSIYLPYNFIKEVDLKAGGYEAEYQGALGGIINVITKSGTNEFHSSIFGFYTTNILSVNKKLSSSDPTQGDFSDYDVGFSLGGPILIDKLWFFAAYNPKFDNHNVTIPDFGIGLDKTVRHSFAVKLNYTASQQLRFGLTFTGDPSKREAVGKHVFRPPYGLENPDIYLQDIREGGYNFSLNGIYNISQNITIDAIFSHVYRYYAEKPSTEKGNDFHFEDRVNNIWGGGVGGSSDVPRNANTGRIIASISTLRHMLIMGIQYKESADYGQYKYLNLVRFNDSTYREIFGMGFQSTISQRLPSIFLQDLWTITNNLRFYAGLRWDGQYILGTNNKVDQKIIIPLQPRAGVTFIPDDEGRSKIFASYGRFAQELNLSVNRPFLSNQGYDSTIFYTHDPRISRDGGIVNPVSGPHTLYPEIENLQGQYFDEFSLGYEKLLWNNFRFSVQGLYRTLGQAIDDGFVPSQNTLRLGNPGSYPLNDLPKATRKYTALIISFERYGDQYFNFIASYVLSRNYGNYEGLFDAFYHSESPNQNFSFNNSFELNNIEGLLPNDRTHVFKFSGSYNFLFGLTMGITFLLQSGTPLSEYTSGTNFIGIRFLSKRGSAGRTPTIWELAARFTYELPAINSIHSRIIVDLFHIASQLKPVEFNQRKYLTDSEGNPGQPNPEYGNPYRYQQPMSMRIGMEINL